MKYLAIDYGLSKIGLAISEGYFANPFRVISHEKWEIKLPKIIETEKISIIIIGVSEGLSKEKALEFGKELAKLTPIPLVFWDETLTTKTALSKMIESGKSQKYRKNMQDAAAAAEILQSYIDNTSL